MIVFLPIYLSANPSSSISVPIMTEALLARAKRLAENVSANASLLANLKRRQRT